MDKSDTPVVKVLIMEDEVDMRFYLMALVKSMGFSPLMSRNGEQGLDLLRQARGEVDLIILDVMMPEKGGALVYRELKTDPALSGIPLVIFSGVESSAFGHYVKMLNTEPGMDIPEPRYYVEKTADPEHLKSVIQSCLQEGA